MTDNLWFHQRIQVWLTLGGTAAPPGGWFTRFSRYDTVITPLRPSTQADKCNQFSTPAELKQFSKIDLWRRKNVVKEKQLLLRLVVYFVGRSSFLSVLSLFFSPPFSLAQIKKTKNPPGGAIAPAICFVLMWPGELPGGSRTSCSLDTLVNGAEASSTLFAVSDVVRRQPN